MKQPLRGLIECWECGADISRNARACPQCGAPPKAEVRQANARSWGRGFVSLFWLSVLGGIVWVIATG